ncbi:MAG TPA: glycoside hydrolase family 88 protein [Planctomycetota bacterium]|nr:glycoside hydrolase family 88 protein [Planctomycetota bacterium]
MLKADSLVTSSVKTAFKFAQVKVRALIEKYPNYYPTYTVAGKWKHAGERWTNWCDGFLPGMMWIFHQHTADDYWFNAAIKYTKPLEHRKDDQSVHDLGFIFFSSYLRWMLATEPKDPQLAADLDNVVVQAGATLSLRFKEKGEYLSSFVGPESLFIDIMMNVPIIFYASKRLRKRGNKKDAAELLKVANAHCKTTLRMLLRGDGSTAHEGIFDPETGEFLRQSTHQGFRADSCWSRGLAWAIYGFCTAYNFTGNTDYLDASEMCARYYIRNTPDSGVPPWDYDADTEESRSLLDSSAAAIASSGLYDLSLVSPSFEHRYLYRQYYRKIITTLCTSQFLSRDANCEGILRHGVYHIHKNLGVDECVMWGDYFFVEALSKALAEERR